MFTWNNQILRGFNLTAIAIDGYLVSVEYSLKFQRYHTGRCQNQCTVPVQLHSNRKLVCRVVVPGNSRLDIRSIAAVCVRCKNENGDSIRMCAWPENRLFIVEVYDCVCVACVHITKSDSILSLNSLQFCLSNTLKFFHLVCDWMQSYTGKHLHIAYVWCQRGF